MGVHEKPSQYSSASHLAASYVDNVYRKTGECGREEPSHNILNTLEMHMSNAMIEAINNKIKLIVRRPYSFRNIQNMHRYGAVDLLESDDPHAEESAPSIFSG